MSDSCEYSSPEPGPSPASSRWALWTTVAVAVALVLAVVLRGLVGGVLMALVALAGVVVTAMMWQRLDAPARMARLAVVLVLAAGSVVMLAPR